MGMGTFMKIKSDIIMQKVGTSYLAVAVGARAKELSCMIKLNESGAFLWNVAKDSGLDRGILANALAAEYGIELETALADTDRFIDTLIKNGLCEE